MYHQSLVLAILTFGIVQAINSEPLNCFHELYVRRFALRSQSHPDEYAYIGEVANMSTDIMTSLTLNASKQFKWPDDGDICVYLKGYCIPPPGLTAFTYIADAHESFDMSLQNRDKVPTKHLTTLDPQGKVEHWVKLNVECRKIVEFSSLSVSNASKDAISGLTMTQRSNIFRLFPDNHEAFINQSANDLETRHFLENHICLAEQGVRYETPIKPIFESETDMVLMRAKDDVQWLTETAKGRWYSKEYQYWVHKDAKGVFCSWHLTNTIPGTVMMTTTLGVISA